MILADKIILLRKKNGWSQEELAQQLEVSRQAVSKWEGAQATPDLERILRMSQVFGVSTDYLLKDEIEESEAVPVQETISGSSTVTRAVSLEEANNFLAAKEATVSRIAIGSFLCILAPVVLLLLVGTATFSSTPLPANAAVAIGLTLMLLLVLIAVMLFISCRKYTSPFDYLETEVIETGYGVKGMVMEVRQQHSARHRQLLFSGCCAAIISPLPLLLGALLGASSMMVILCLCLTILLAGVSAIIFILRGIPEESYDKLLEEGSYTRARKTSAIPVDAISTAYWLLAVAVVLLYSCTTTDWEMSWIIWPIAGVLFAALSPILSSRADRRR